jgi:hypothetical protein
MKIIQKLNRILYIRTFMIIITLVFVVPGCDNQENEPVKDRVQIIKNLKSDFVIIVKLIPSYSDFIDSVSNNKVYFKDNSTLTFDNSTDKLSFDDTLNFASIKDQFCQIYSIGKDYQIPIPCNFDPGRIRNDEFFKKIYGKTKEEVEHNLTTVQWLPNKLGVKVSFSKINNAAKQLQKVSNELDMLPDSLLKYLQSIGGTFIWKEIAGTNRLSAHSLGIAIDINNHNSNYWRNTKTNSKGMYAYRNRIPWEIVSIFEKYGFIWGGKWYHYDTMHFEYRPELINP